MINIQDEYEYDYHLLLANSPALKQLEPPYEVSQIRDMSKGKLRLLLRRHRDAMYLHWRREHLSHSEATALLSADPIAVLLEDELVEREDSAPIL